MTDLKIVSTYLTDAEKEQIQKGAMARNQTLSTYVKELIMDKYQDIPQAWMDKANKNGFSDVREFINAAINLYNIPRTAPIDRSSKDEVLRLQNEIIILKAEIIKLKTPKTDANIKNMVDFAKYRDELKAKIENILTDHYISVQEICDKLDIQDEDSYYHFINAVRYNENIEYNSRFGYRLKKVKS